jgi:hypothetical protein
VIKANMNKSEKKMGAERRKFLRFGCEIPSEAIKTDSQYNFVESLKVIDFSRDGLKLNVNFNAPDPGSDMQLKLYIPGKQYVANLIGEIIWRKYIDNRLEVGLKIEHMENQARGEVLNWIFPQWADKENRKKEALHDILYKGINNNVLLKNMTQSNGIKKHD